MSHSPIAGLLKKMFAESVKKDQQVLEEYKQRGESRRKFLRDTSLAAGGMMFMPSLLTPQCPLPAQKVVIIGAGIAGLNACYQLKKQGIAATVYEASERVGGRMFTMKDEFGQGLSTDIGGEFVDSTHTEILELVKELGLSLYDLREDKLSPKTLFFEGKHRSNEELRNAFAPFVRKLVEDIKSLPEKISYETANSFRQFDSQSITEYISGIGITGWLYDFINVVLTREYGMEAAEQSAINFLIMFDAPPAAGDKYYEMFGDDHEIFKIKGGSQQLTDALYQRVKEQVLLKHKLLSIGQHKAGSYELLLEDNKTKKTVPADHVIMAIPFTVLRNIQMDVPMPAEKRKCINEIGYGNSCKFVMGFNGKAWRNAGKQGYTFTDSSFGCGWDSTQSQSQEKASFTVFGGGHFGDDLYVKNKEGLVADFIPGLETIYPGAEKLYSGKNIKFCWQKNPFSLAGYSSFKKGQWSTLAGWEGVPVGNIHFAGEHVSRDFQGYMNGGAQTARMAVAQIMEKLAQMNTKA